MGRAIPLYERTLADSERVLGPDHPDTLLSRHNLAGAYESAGDLGRAIPLYERTLADSERVLGPDHPDTLLSRHNLAGAYESAGDLGRAIPLYERTLADSERVLGPDHPDTLLSRHSLVRLRGEAGDVAGAAAALQDLLADYVRVLGPDHPHTLTTRNNLAHLRGEAGDVAGAAAALQDLLADYVRVLGPDHPHTLTTQNNLAQWQVGDPSDHLSEGSRGILAEALVALAAASGTAVVQVAGTDAWQTLRQRVARLLGRGSPEREQVELERLDRTAAVLNAAREGETERVLASQEATWQTRFETLLEAAGDDEREQFTAVLGELVEQSRHARVAGGGVSDNAFHGPTAFQVGDHNRQDNHFGSGA
ncbi:nephrocystin (plasmid) [Streptomyces sp. GBA 94-10 4N24]|nr:nephrocystin [Streptomyces sp. GBA 94-10 4N24]UZN63167.1 nephrocystin [Streptomyces sp. GBA 94-10 4N24]